MIRECLTRIGLDQNLLRHGISREVYAMPLADNWQDYLRGKTKTCVLDRPISKDIAIAARDRWIVPRAARRPDYALWTREDTMDLLRPLLPDEPIRALPLDDVGISGGAR